MWLAKDEEDIAGAVNKGEEEILLSVLFDTLLSVARANGLVGKVHPVYSVEGKVQAPSQLTRSIGSEKETRIRDFNTAPEHRHYSELCHGGKHRSYQGSVSGITRGYGNG